MPKIDLAKAVVREGASWGPPLDAHHKGKTRWKLGDAAGLSQFGVNLMRLAPGCWSAERHWHTAEDELVFVLEGEVVLVDDEGEHVLKAGEAAGFPAGAANGHCLQNRSAADAVVLEVGSRRPEADLCTYPDIRMVMDAQGRRPL